MKVLIVGGGLGGLLLAHKLVQHNLSVSDNKLEVVVLERDASKDARSQGIVIGLGQDGVNAMLSLNLGYILEELMSEKGPRNLSLRGFNGTELIGVKNLMRVKLDKGKTASCLLPRSSLRAKLAETLPDGIIKWDARVASIREENNKVFATLENGEVVEGDVLIGADGARSKVREQYFPELTPKSLGLYTCWGTLSAAEFDALKSPNKIVEISKTALTRTGGRYGCSMLSFVFFPRADDLGERTMIWSISMPNDVDIELVRNSDMPNDEFRRRVVTIVKKAFDDESLHAVVEKTTHVVPGYELFSVDPVIYKPKTISQNIKKDLRVTVLGDAAHKTTTQAGLGATAAFQDALDLGETIIRHKSDFGGEHLREYEHRMCSRASWVVGASTFNTKNIHAIRGEIGLRLSNGFMWSIGCLVPAFQFVSSVVRRDWS